MSKGITKRADDFARPRLDFVANAEPSLDERPALVERGDGGHHAVSRPGNGSG